MPVNLRIVTLCARHCYSSSCKVSQGELGICGLSLRKLRPQRASRPCPWGSFGLCLPVESRAQEWADWGSNRSGQERVSSPSQNVAATGRVWPWSRGRVPSSGDASSGGWRVGNQTSGPMGEMLIRGYCAAMSKIFKTKEDT